MITTHSTSTTEASQPRRPETEPIPVTPSIRTASRSRRPLSVIDRLALTLGVALVTWSRRPRIADRRDELQLRVERISGQERRMREHQRLMLTLLPPR